MTKSKDHIFSLMTLGYVTVVMVAYGINYRLFAQINGRVDINDGLGKGISELTKIFIDIGGGTHFMYAVIPFALALFFIGQFMKPGDEEKKRKIKYKVALWTSILLWAVVIAISPFQQLVFGSNSYSTIFFIFFSAIYLTALLAYLYGGGVVFRRGGNDSKSSSEDPFGKNLRAFPQNEKLMKTDISVNIKYEFLSPKNFKMTPGYINVINQFRGNQVLGTPGSGKSYAFFLPMIEQNVRNGFSMLIYDYKYPDLSAHAITCMDLYKEQILKKRGRLPKINSIYFDNVFYSKRVNVLQPELLNDFAFDAVNVANSFMMAINKSWMGKEGEFFPESAKNLLAATVWSLKIYKDGIYCTLPHAIELLSQSMEDLFGVFMALEDISLRNVVKPFKDALEKEAMEQVAGQVASVTVPLARLSSPTVSWVLTTDPKEEELRLDINDPNEYQILCLGNSSEKKSVNNVFFSLFITQLFKLINVKGRLPLAVVLDEVVTLSFPKGTLDDLIATGRGHLIAVWLGYQDLSQLHRDMTKDVGDSIFKMVGNTFAGNINDETSEKLEKRIGKVEINKKEKSLSAEEELSYSFRKSEDSAVPASYFSSMSQGVFAGIVADNYGEEIEIKPFYGKVNYSTPYGKNIKTMEMTDFWKSLFKDNGIEYAEFKAVSDRKLKESENWKKASELKDQLLKENHERIVKEVNEMVYDLVKSKTETEITN